jgi:hypothetical protein
MDQREIESVVIGVTPSALLAAGCICPHPKRVHAAPLRNSIADFHMAFQAFELLGATTQTMTFAAVCRSRERLMSLRKGSGRDLCAHRMLSHNYEAQDNGNNHADRHTSRLPSRCRSSKHPTLPTRFPDMDAVEHAIIHVRAS